MTDTEGYTKLQTNPQEPPPPPSFPPPIKRYTPDDRCKSKAHCFCLSALCCFVPNIGPLVGLLICGAAAHDVMISEDVDHEELYRCNCESQLIQLERLIKEGGNKANEIKTCVKTITAYYKHAKDSHYEDYGSKYIDEQRFKKLLKNPTCQQAVKNTGWLSFYLSMAQAVDDRQSKAAPCAC